MLEVYFTCGQFLPCGRAPGHRGSSVANSFPNPDIYFSSAILKYSAREGFLQINSSSQLHEVKIKMDTLCNGTVQRAMQHIYLAIFQSIGLS